MPKYPSIPWADIGQRKVKPKQAAGLLIDLRRCTGCHACSVACKTEFNVPLGQFRTRVRYLQKPEENTLSFLPLLCMQCADAPCLKACPTQALEQRKDGVITVNDEKCCGEKKCVSACPYGAIFVSAETKKAEKCDLCVDRTDLGMDPACVDVCPTEALKYTDWADAAAPATKQAQQQKASTFKAGANTKPRVKYIGLQSWMEGQAASIQLTLGEHEIIYESPPPKSPKK